MRKVNINLAARKTYIYLGLAFIIVGLILLIALQVSLGSKSPPAASAAAVNKALHSPADSGLAPNAADTLSGTPTHIDIPAVGINLDVIPGYYYPATKSWTLSLSDAQYAANTKPANNTGGATFIYAHNRRGVFMSLPDITKGALAKITTSNGHVFSYAYRTSVVTTPDNTSIFAYQGKPILVAQTCTGIWYQNRQLFIFDLVGAA